MTIEITSTKRNYHFVKIAVYGQAGVGKTVLCSTAPKPLIISAEAGLMSLASKEVDVIEITSLAELRSAYEYVEAGDHPYETVCLDSISEIAEVSFSTELARITEKAQLDGTGVDPRQAYGSMAIHMLQITRKFRNLKNINLVLTAKLGSIKDSVTNVTNFGPAIPGQAFTTNFPYLVDILCAMRVDKEGNRYLQTNPDFQWLAKDRSGRLSKQEKPNLTDIFNKISHHVPILPSKGNT